MQRVAKKIAEILPAPPGHWVGDGFPVRTMFSYNSHGKSLSPFLLLDYAAPASFSASGKPKGVGQHPHRGFETVTVVYQGEVEHRDSSGAGGKIGPGDVQWMTAASGVLHEEMHSREFTARGGMMEMVQLWVNLPAKLKMSDPHYQEILKSQIPVVELPDDSGNVRVIAGVFGATQGAAKTFTPINLWDVRLKKGRETDLDLISGHTAALFILKGKLLSGDKVFGPIELALFERDGDKIKVKAVEETVFMVLSGEPIHEPIAGYGPFVMNTQEEIRQAVEDHQHGRMGRLK